MEISLRLVRIVIWATETQTSIVNSERQCLACARICLDSLNSGRILGGNQRAPDSEIATHDGFAIELRDAIENSDASNSFSPHVPGLRT